MLCYTLTTVCYTSNTLSELYLHFVMLPLYFVPFPFHVVNLPPPSPIQASCQTPGAFPRVAWQHPGSVGTTCQGKEKVCEERKKEVSVGQAGREWVQGGGRPMGAATYGGKGFKERAAVSGEKPRGAASCGQQHIQASRHPPPPLDGVNPTRHRSLNCCWTLILFHDTWM